MPIEDLFHLPKEVQEAIYSLDISNKNIALSDKFGLNKDQMGFILSIETDIFLKKADVMDVPRALENMERAKFYDLRSIALDLAYNIFWPLSGYLEHVDRLILRLGGKVPSQKVFLGQGITQKNIFPGAEKSTVKLLLNKYEDFKNLLVTVHKIGTRDGRQVSPTVANWLQDYINFLGAGAHSSLERAQYLAKGPNILKLSDGDRDKARRLILSYDEGQEFDFVLNQGLLSIQDPKSAAQAPAEDFDKILAKMYDKISAFKAGLMSGDLILSEVNNDANRLADVLWDALGAPDKEKSISILQILMQKKMLGTLIAQDNRFKNIFKRFIELKYGHSFVAWPDTNQDKLMTLRLFLEMILAQKLGLNLADSALAALYLTNADRDRGGPASPSQGGQIIYFDKSDNQLKWREVAQIGSNLTWTYPA